MPLAVIVDSGFAGSPDLENGVAAKSNQRA
jgi:hypothetical protein